MKNQRMALVCILLFFCWLFISADDGQPRDNTQIGQLLNSKNVIFIKQYTLIATLEGDFNDKINIKTLTVSSPTNAFQQLKGLCLEYSSKSSSISDTVSSSRRSLIDYSEIQGILDVINLMQKTSQNWVKAPSPYNEITFLTKNNVEIGFFQTDRQAVYIQFISDANNSPTCYFLNVNDFFNKFISSLKKAKELLDSK